MRGLVWRWVINGLALFLTAQLFASIEIKSFGSALIAALVLGLANAVIRPIIKIITFPITILTLGLFTFIINGFILWLVQANVTGFVITNFWSAVLGAIVLSVISAILTSLISDQN
ncbi:phage holin family protein [Anaerobranca gottschalkii]|uniref:Putative membrane protein n=1 Tax=Anaerobranca gottschalkii DSM 13577 TaxID=1120990 RepID=A0A1H9ZPY6_9FIRM|nr:phage holin family protein [Anaerobranca gottschalkii]SES83762.1 putative membrane protein [Anaerobranca gottschalkii DSM 13577]